MTRRLIPVFALVLAACGGDEELVPVSTDTGSGDTAGGDDTASEADAGGASDTGTAPDDGTDEPDVPAEAAVTLTLTNANPGGLSRWVQIENNLGVPGWWNVLRAGTLDDFVRVHRTCTVCGCDEPDCDPCAPEPDILEIAPGESVTATWHGNIWNIAQTPAVCLETVERAEDEFSVEFVWSPEPPGDDGVLPVGTLSRTRITFTFADGAEVTYEIEALAGE